MTKLSNIGLENQPKIKRGVILNTLKMFMSILQNKTKTIRTLMLLNHELMIAQGSDWFWWYGEPNNSGQDFVFDYMFRERLKMFTLF